MTTDTIIPATLCSLEEAVSCMARVMELPVPERTLILRYPDEVHGLSLDDTAGFVDLDRGYVCLPRQVRRNTMFHEAAHWVLLNNDVNYAAQNELIYGRLFDEMFSGLAQMTLTGTTIEPLLDKDDVTEKKNSQQRVKDLFESAYIIYQQIVDEQAGIPDEEILARRNTCAQNIQRCDTLMSICDYVYWHFTIEEKWDNAFGQQISWPEFMSELQAFHESLSKEEPVVMMALTENLAHRGAIAHYLYGHKPQDLFNGMLRFSTEQGNPLAFTYFMFTAQMAQDVFEKKKIEEWMHEPTYLTP